MSVPFALPPIIEGGENPVWKDSVFHIGQETTPVLQYSLNDTGWNDDLTFFHEETAGDDHFIDRASRDYALSQLLSFIPSNSSATLLEVGCSSGYMLERLYNAYPSATVMGSDVVVAPLQKLAKQLPGTPLLRFDLLNCPLPDSCIDAIVLLNVLEHIEDDEAALKQIYRILKPGGVLIIEVPAGPKLYDVYDKILMHYRRYTQSELKQKTLQAGFKICRSSHLGFWVYPAFWLVKQLNKRMLNESEAVQKQQVQKNIRESKNKLMHALMRLELFLGRWVRYPVGIRCLMTCQK